MNGTIRNISRRRLLELTGAGAMALAAGRRAVTAPRSIGEIYELKVCPSTPQNPRNDHAQIFPLSEGRLLLCWSEYYATRPSQILEDRYSADYGDDAQCRISGKVSTDRGRTWSGTITLQDNLGGRNVKQSNLVRTASGEVLFFFTSWAGAEDDRRIYFKRSKDDCETWTDPVQLSPTGGFYVLDAGNIFTHSSGRIILPAYWSPGIWKDKEHFTAFCYYSDDDGKTWNQSKNRIDIADRGAMEPAVAERSDGSLLAILRTHLGKLYQATSDDRGESWSKAEPTKLPSPEAEPCLRTIPGTGDLLLIWNHAIPFALSKPGSKEFHRPRNPLTAAVSRDGGRTWQNFKDIENRTGYDSAYASVTFVGKEALVTYYHQSASVGSTGELVLKIFPIEWFYA